MKFATKTITSSRERSIAFFWFLICAIALAVVNSATMAKAQTAAEQDSTEQQSVATEDPAIDDPYGINKKPKVSEGIGVDDHIGQFVSGDQSFNDHDNNHVKFGHFFGGDQPVMLSFNYSNCPKLCSVQLQNMTSCLRDVDFEIGKDFQLVSVSIDPNEQTSRARDTREKFMGQYKPSRE